MNIVWAPAHDSDFNKALSGWISAQIWKDERQVQAPNLCFGVFKATELQGAVAFHGWNPHYGTVELTGAAVGVNWLSRAVIREIARYAFDDLGCQLLIVRTNLSDTHTIRIFTALGFSRVDLPRLRGRDNPEVLLTFTDEARELSRFTRRS